MAVATLKEAIGIIQRGCDAPLYESLSDSRVADFLVQAGDFVNSELGLTGRPWNFSSFDITVQAGEDYHAITEVGNFTVPFAVETKNPANPNHVVRVLVLNDPVEAVRWHQAGTLGPGGVMHSALSVTFTEHPEQPGVRAARFAPKPNAQGTYVCYYAPNVLRPQSLDSAVIKFPQFENYIYSRVILQALPYCAWEGMSDEQNAAKRETLQGDPRTPGTNAFLFNQYETQFIRLRRQTHQNHLARAVPFGRLGRGRR